MHIVHLHYHFCFLAVAFVSTLLGTLNEFTRIIHLFNVLLSDKRGWTLNHVLWFCANVKFAAYKSAN